MNCKSKLYLESPLAECDVDHLLKIQNAKVYRTLMLSQGQNGYRLPAPQITASPSLRKRESGPVSTSRQPSLRKPKYSHSIGAVRTPHPISPPLLPFPTPRQPIDSAGIHPQAQSLCDD